jgi:hypothetical protein
MKRIKILAIALILCSAAFVSLSAFKANDQAKISTSGQYIYNLSSDDEEDFRDILNWTLVDTEHPAPTDCPDTDQVPCYVTYSGSNFSSFLSTASMPDLLNISDGTKSAQ